MNNLTMRFLLTALTSMVCFAASAYSCKIDGVCYNVQNSDLTASVTFSGYPYNNEYTGHYHSSDKLTGDLQIPATITYNEVEYTVTAIADYAFYDAESTIGITSVTIPSTVTSIGRAAFLKTSLSAVTVEWDTPLSLSSNNSTFPNLANITLYVPSGSKAAYESADYWKGFKEIVEMEDEAVLKVGDTFTAAVPLGSGTVDMTFKVTSDNPLEVKVGTGISYSNCISKTSSGVLTIPAEVNGCTVTSIANNAFYDCSRITGINLPATLTSIEANAFATMTGLKYIEIPSGVTAIPEYVFNGCTALESIQLPKGLQSIGTSAFTYCQKLQTISIPEGVTAISESLFRNCSSLQSVALLGDVSAIGANAFSDCNSLTELTVYAMVPPAVVSSSLRTTDVTLYVPYGCKAAYETADYWKEFKEIVEMEPTSLEITDLSQTDYAVYVENTEAFAGRQATLSVKMKNAAAVQTIQFDLYLPEGVSVVDNEDGELVTASKERIKKFNYFNSSRQADGAIRLLAQATTTNVAAGDGEICTVTINIPDDMAEGEYPLIVKNAMLVEQDNTNHSPEPNLVQSKLAVWAYIPGDANGDGEINAIDFNIIGNLILGYSQTGVNEKAADINGDGEVNAIDFNMVGNIILNGSDAAARAARAEEKKDPA